MSLADMEVQVEESLPGAGAHREVHYHSISYDPAVCVLSVMSMSLWVRVEGYCIANAEVS